MHLSMSASLKIGNVTQRKVLNGPKKKENIDAVMEGSYNYIRLAYDVRSRLVILPITAKVVTTPEAIYHTEQDKLELEVPTVVEVQHI